MNILVCVKRVPLTGGKITLTDDEQAIQTRHLGFTISPHEECGAEEAIRLIEQHGGSSTVLTLGPAEAEEQLRDMMAIGIDQGIHIVTDGTEWDPQATAAAIVAAIRPDPLQYDLILFGNESADAGNYQVAIRVATALGLPCVNGVKAIAVADDGRLRCEQEIAGGRDVYLVPTPAVVSVKEGINLPATRRSPAGCAPSANRFRAPRRRAPTAGSRWCGWYCHRPRPSRQRCWGPAPRRPRPWSGSCRRSGSSDAAGVRRGPGRRAFPAGVRARPRDGRGRERGDDQLRRRVRAGRLGADARRAGGAAVAVGRRRPGNRSRQRGARLRGRQARSADGGQLRLG